MKRTLTVAIALAAFSLAVAMPPFPKAFQAHYKIKKESKLFKTNCAVCHTTPGGGKLNPYGHDLQEAIRALKTKTVTPEALKRIEKLDSDKDGTKNIDEIKRDTNPGAK